MRYTGTGTALGAAKQPPVLAQPGCRIVSRGVAPGLRPQSPRLRTPRRWVTDELPPGYPAQSDRRLGLAAPPPDRRGGPHLLARAHRGYGADWLRARGVRARAGAVPITAVQGGRDWARVRGDLPFGKRRSCHHHRLLGAWYEVPQATVLGECRGHRTIVRARGGHHGDQNLLATRGTQPRERDMATTSYGARARPTSTFEVYSWFFMRVSGVVLLFMVLGHLAIMHIINSVDTIDYWW